MTEADSVMSKTSFDHVLDVRTDQVDLADWLFTLGNEEYQRCCPPDHIACGSTHSDDGTPMSINVEYIDGALMIQEYVAEVHGSNYCKMVSTSDTFFGDVRTKIGVIWELSVEAIDESSSRFTNSVTVLATPEFRDLIEQNGETFEAAAARQGESTTRHNRRETPLFGESIARAARARQAVGA